MRLNGQAHVLEVEHGVDRLFREDLGRILVDEVVAALDGVEGVPLPGVLFDVGERRGHTALRRAGVRAGGVELRDDRCAGLRARLDGGPHPGPAGADDDDVVAVIVDAVDDVAVFELHGAGVRDPGAGRRHHCAAHSSIRASEVGSPRQGSKKASTRVPRMSSTAVAAPRANRSRRRSAPRRVVVDERAHAVRAMDECQPQQQQVPDDPERVGELAGDEGPVDGADALAGEEVDEEVAEDQHDEHDARDAHVDPAPLLPVDAATAGQPRAAGCVDGQLRVAHPSLPSEDVHQVAGQEADAAARPRARRRSRT